MSSKSFCCISSRKSLEVVEGFKLGLALEKDVAFDPPRNPGAKMVRSMATGRDSEDVVEFLQCSLPAQIHPLVRFRVRRRVLDALGFWETEQDDNESKHIEAGVEPESYEEVSLAV